MCIRDSKTDGDGEVATQQLPPKEAPRHFDEGGDMGRIASGGRVGAFPGWHSGVVGVKRQPRMDEWVYFPGDTENSSRLNTSLRWKSGCTSRVALMLP